MNKSKSLSLITSLVMQLALMVVLILTPVHIVQAQGLEVVGTPTILAETSGVKGATEASTFGITSSLQPTIAPVLIQEPSPFGYFPLASLGVTPFACPSDCDDGGVVLGVPPFTYLGASYSVVVWSVNGTLEVGTASGIPAGATNQNLPDLTSPNNILAPWWTDLDLSAGGNWYVAVVSAGPTTFLVAEWRNVPRFGDPTSTFSFQIWIEQGTDNIWFAYDVYSGNTTDGTTGAENSNGMLGDTVYFDGSGVNPWGGSDWRVTAVELDSDGDGVLDADDVCPGTALPEATPEQAKKNRYYVNSNGDFIDGQGNLAGISISDTGGCSGIQIIEASQLGAGHVRQGITRSALLEWIASLW